MKTLVLSVDRDDDFGQKSGLNSPIIGREESINAALSLGLKDAEDSDVNTLLAAIGMYDEMVRKGIDTEIALICGDAKVGYESDLILSTQLENVLEMVKPDRVVLVSDGAEDEFIYPVISSRATIDSVRRVYVKQAPGVEGMYYIIMKMMKDKDIIMRLLTPIALVFIIFGLFSVIPQLWDLSLTWDMTKISQMAGGSIALILGLYLIYYIYDLSMRFKRFKNEFARAVKSGSQMIPFAILSVILVFAGIVFGADAALKDGGVDPLNQLLLFVGNLLWLLCFAFLSYETGRFVNLYMSQGRFNATYLVASVEVFAIAFIAQGAIDAVRFLFGYYPIETTLIFLEVIVGFLMAVFGGLLNTSFRDLVVGNGEETTEALQIE